MIVPEINTSRKSTPPGKKTRLHIYSQTNNQISNLTDRNMSHRGECRSSYVRYMCGHETPTVISRGVGCRSCARTGSTCITPPPIRVLRQSRCPTCRQRRNGDGSRGRGGASSQGASRAGNSVCGGNSRLGPTHGTSHRGRGSPGRATPSASRGRGSRRAR
jgi:hypothetical protein